MTPPALVTAAAVREYMRLNAVSGDSAYSDATIGSNIKAAGWFLEKATGRRLADRTETLKFTTNGATNVIIPGLRTPTSVTQSGSTLTEDSSYWLIPDAQQTGVYIGIQFRAYAVRNSGPWYLRNPEWFDRGLDMHNHSGRYTSQPNDLVIAGDWGYVAGSLPSPAAWACTVMAGWITKRPDALLSGAIATPEGNVFDLSSLPVEVKSFIEEWRVSPFAMAVG